MSIDIPRVREIAVLARAQTSSEVPNSTYVTWLNDALDAALDDLEELQQRIRLVIDMTPGDQRFGDEDVEDMLHRRVVALLTADYPIPAERAEAWPV